jgi:protein TonB
MPLRVDLASSKEGVAPVKDRLITTLFLAGLFHGIVILGVSFGVGALNPHALPTLEVLLVSNQAPESRSNPQADYLSQRTQQGSGNTRDGRAASPASSPLPFDNPGIPEGRSLANEETGRERGADLLAGNAAMVELVHLADATDVTTGSRQRALLMQASPVAPLLAHDDSEQLLLKGGRQGELLVTPNTRESDVAVYLDAWKHKVERIGTLHFPPEARRRGLSGSPVLEVAIRSNGVIEDIIVRRSSGHIELDQAALAILKLSTPFDPFPAELRDRHRVLRFAYEWQFLGGELVDSAVREPDT